MHTFLVVLGIVITFVIVVAIVRFFIMVPSILIDLVTTLQEIRDKLK